MTREFFSKVLAAGGAVTRRCIYLVEVRGDVRVIVRYRRTSDGAVWLSRDGVDGNSFVLSRVNNECRNIYDVHKLYFALYFMEIKEEEEEEGYKDFYKVETNGYYL